MKHQIKELSEVFSKEFIDYILNEKMNLQGARLVFRRIAEYEQKHGVEFVCFFANQFIVFK